MWRENCRLKMEDKDVYVKFKITVWSNVRVKTSQGIDAFEGAHQESCHQCHIFGKYSHITGLVPHISDTSLA